MSDESLSGGAPRSWREIVVEVDRSAEDGVAALLCGAGATGVRSDDEGARVLLSACFPAEGSPNRVEEVSAILGGASAGSAARIVAVREVEDGRWVERWVAALAPFPVGESLMVVPVPDPDLPPARGAPPAGEAAGRIALRIHPSRAFGTGEHATTRLCLEALESLPLPGLTVLDVGTGSGILAIASAKLGCRLAVGIDLDEEAIAVARANVALNGCADRVRLACGGTEALGARRVDVVVANLNAYVLANVMPHLIERLAPAGTLILSGLLGTEAAGLAERARTLRPGRSRIAAREGWACVVHGGALG